MPAHTPSGPGAGEPAAVVPPLDRLRALAAQDRLTAEYPAVAGLLTEIVSTGGDRVAADLVRAGQLLSRLDPEQVASAHPGTPTVSVAVTGHSTVGAVAAPLTAELARHGLLLDLTLGDFDSYLRELQDTGSRLYAPGLDLALVVLDAQAVFDELPVVWRVEDLAQAAMRKLAELSVLARRHLEHGTAALVLNTLPLQRIHTHQLVDLRSRAALGVAWREFNAGLLRLSAAHERVFVVDLDPLVALGGPVNDPRMAAYAKANLGGELLGRYAREIGHLARSLRGGARKVLVVDLDNTLWDGVLGDDGADGVAAATTYRGEAFGAFQRVVKQIGSQGVLLAVSSKNDQDGVAEVLRSHPDMVLRDADFVRVNANWEPKDANLRDIAGRLNLSTDSLVFADDSAFEAGLVASRMPEVAVVRLNEEPALHIERLLADGWFDVRELTAHDRERPALYRAESDRRELRESSGSAEEYLRHLGVRVTVTPVDPGEFARVAQLTLRTNQFNLTTLRLQPAEVRARREARGGLALSVRSADRFGDNGVVGALFAHLTPGNGHAGGDSLSIDNLLLSCRVFARGIEQAVVAAVLGHARARGLASVTASYRPSSKNRRTRDFWPTLGFEQTAASGEELLFVHSLVELPEVPGHLRLEADLGCPGDPAPRP
ncbi:HAD-IIIC family phosphatase [Streptacidiphilus sp. PAMC 29251]